MEVESWQISLWWRWKLKSERKLTDRVKGWKLKVEMPWGCPWGGRRRIPIGRSSLRGGGGGPTRSRRPCSAPEGIDFWDSKNRFSRFQKSESKNQSTSEIPKIVSESKNFRYQQKSFLNLWKDQTKTHLYQKKRKIQISPGRSDNLCILLGLLYKKGFYFGCLFSRVVKGFHAFSFFF